MASNTPKRRTNKSKATAASKVAASAVEPKKKRKRIDYEMMEADWRAGLLSPRQIAAKYIEATGQSVSHAAIIKHFRKREIPRDLSAKVKAKAEALVTASLVTHKVTPEEEKKHQERDDAIVDANARKLASVQLSHRKDIKRARDLTNAMLDELQTQTDPEVLDALRELGEIMRAPDEKGVDKLNDLYRYVISLPERSKTLKSLGDTLERLVNMERKAFNMDKVEPVNTDPLTAMLARIGAVGGTIEPVSDDPGRGAWMPKDDDE